MAEATNEAAMAVSELNRALEAWERSLTLDEVKQAEAEGMYPRHWLSDGRIYWCGGAWEPAELHACLPADRGATGGANAMNGITLYFWLMLAWLELGWSVSGMVESADLGRSLTVALNRATWAIRAQAEAKRQLAL